VIVRALIASNGRAHKPAAAISACLLLLGGCGGASDEHARAAGHSDPSARSLKSTPTTHSAQRTPPHAAPAAARSAACAPHPPPEQQITRRGWLGGVIVTEYYPVPERWSEGALVRAPGLAGRHRVDWLYSAKGLSMEGDGVDLAGGRVHIEDLGSVGWVNAAGSSTVPPRCGVRWSAGPPYWRAGGWRNSAGDVTYRLAGGGWSNGAGHWVGGYGGASFAYGASLPLRYYHSVAVDPKLIPLGSRIYVPAYGHISGGWFTAQDTGGAIIGRHIDVYRPPTPQRYGSGRLLLHQRIYVVPPGA
jgi:3D (Asp-Asp-Asp) domain-containing protein